MVIVKMEYIYQMCRSDRNVPVFFLKGYNGSNHVKIIFVFLTTWLIQTSF